VLLLRKSGLMGCNLHNADVVVCMSMCNGKGLICIVPVSYMV